MDSGKKAGVAVGAGGALAAILRLCSHGGSEVGVVTKSIRAGEEAVAIGKGGAALSKGGRAGGAGIGVGMARTRSVAGKGLVTHGLELSPNLVDLADFARTLDPNSSEDDEAPAMTDASLLDSEYAGRSSGTLLEWAIRYTEVELDKAIELDNKRFSRDASDAYGGLDERPSPSGSDAGPAANAPLAPALRLFAPWHLRGRSPFDGQLREGRAGTGADARSVFPWLSGSWQRTYTAWIPVAQSWYATRSTSRFKIPVFNEPGIISLVPDSVAEFERLFGRRPSDSETGAMDGYRRLSSERPVLPVQAEAKREAPLALLDRALTQTPSRYYVILGWSQEQDSRLSTSDGGKIREGDIHAACLAANKGCWVIRRNISPDSDRAHIADPGLDMIRAGLIAAESQTVWDFTHAMLEAQAATSRNAGAEQPSDGGCLGDAGKARKPTQGCDAGPSRPTRASITLSTMFTSGKGRPTGRVLNDDPPQVFLLMSKQGATAKRGSME